MDPPFLKPQAAVREQLLSTQHALLQLEPIAASRLREAADAGSRLAQLEAQLARVEATAAAAERAAAPSTQHRSTSTALLAAHAPAAHSQLALQSASESAQYTSELCVLLRCAPPPLATALKKLPCCICL